MGLLSGIGILQDYRFSIALSCFQRNCHGEKSNPESPYNLGSQDEVAFDISPTNVHFLYEEATYDQLAYICIVGS